jgi:hypothetical protein
MQQGRCGGMPAILFFGVLVFCFVQCQPQTRQDYTRISEGFVQVPDTVKPWLYWYWISDNISREGISRDLEAMADLGVGTALIGNIGLDNVPQGEVLVLTDEWWEMMRWAVREGKRTGVDIGIFNCPGWSQSGGPWISAEQTMRYLTSAQVHASGPSVFDGVISAPEENFQDVVLLAFPASSERKNLLVQLPVHISTSEGLPDALRMADGDVGTACMFHSRQEIDSMLTIHMKFEEEVSATTLTLHPAHVPMYASCSLYGIEDGDDQLIREFLFDRMNPRNIVGFEPYAPLSLALPGGAYSEYKLEMAFTASPRNTIVKGGISEIELSDIPVVDMYKEKQLAKMHQTPWFSGHEYQWPHQEEPATSQGIIGAENILNISDHLEEDGRVRWQVPEGQWIIQRIGMTPTNVTNHPTLPHATGFEADKMNADVIRHHFESYVDKFWKSLPESDRSAFKYVYADSYETGSQNWTDGLAADFYDQYGYDPLPWLPVLSGIVVESAERSNRFLWDLRRLIADFVAEKYVRGLREAANERGLQFGLENVGHWGFPGETLLYGKYPDFQAGEFWNEGPLGRWENRIASSTAHIYGRNRVFCESFTAGGRLFQRSPMNLKRRGDWSYTEGVNQTIFHLYILQPDNDVKPGINAGFGTEINRHNTWFDLARPWVDYQRRCNYLLQQGKYVADVCYYYGEDAPKLAGYQNIPLPQGYSYDYINYDVIMHRLDVRNGRFVLPDGMSYRVMVLPDSKTMRPSMVERLTALVEKGGIIVGTPPERAPGLKDFPASDEKVRRLADRLWDGRDDSYSGEVQFGRGRVYTGMELSDVLQANDVLPDFQVDRDVPVDWIHRSLPEMEMYFITNQGGESLRFDATFRVGDMQPEWWDAIDGSIRTLPEFERTGEHITLPVVLDPLQSGFVVFTMRKMNATTDRNFPAFEKRIDIAGPWQITFEDPFGESFAVKTDTLFDWSYEEDRRIRYFSGQAVYRTTFDVESAQSEEKLWLDLGHAMVIARVRINDVEVGGLWTNPWRIDVASYLTEGENRLEVEVANNWNNRLIGDAGLAVDQRKSWAAVNVADPGDPLQPSGLIGPVTIGVMR